MADVKWIKIVTDIFDDEKMLLIESLPDADSIIVIWFKLLCLAGKQNNDGIFIMNNTIPYTEKMLATIFRRKESTVQLALNTFEQFGMIEILDGVITIPNWRKHQNLDALKKRKEYNKQYQRGYRARKKELKMAETETEPKKPTKTAPERHKYGEYNNVLLSDVELQKLQDEFPNDWGQRIERLSEYMASSGKTYKSHLATIRKWARGEAERKAAAVPADVPATDQDAKTSYLTPFELEMAREAGQC